MSMGEVKVKKILIVCGAVLSFILVFGFILVFSINRNKNTEYSDWVSLEDYAAAHDTVTDSPAQEVSNDSKDNPDDPQKVSIKETEVSVKPADETNDMTIEEISSDILINSSIKTTDVSEKYYLDSKSINLTQNSPGDKTITNNEVYAAEYTDENGEPITPTTADELVEWAHRAYDEKWTYAYGGCEEGMVDCSGLIKSRVYVCARGTEELLAEAEHKGSIDTIPDIPGLGVYMYGHVGIYVGDGMVIDARTEVSGIGYDAIDYEGWTDWFEIKGVDYSKYMISE